MRPLLITGMPATGKTTLFKQVLSRIRTCDGVASVSGFHVDEVRGSGGGRTGFELVTIPEGARQQFAGLAKDMPPGSPATQVGRWCVHLDKFEETALPIVRAAVESTAEPNQAVVLMIDELAKMELLSAEFSSLMSRLLSQPPEHLYIVCAIASRGQGLVASAKQLPNIDLVEVTLDNRDQLLDTVMLKVNSSLRPRVSS